MTSKEKAEELFQKHYLISQEYTEEIQCGIQAIKSAIVTVEEMLSQYYLVEHESDIRYWEQVKNELEKM